MNLWIDTEFNDFEGELISMALVDEDGECWYASLGCENPSKWVAENVMPIISIRNISKREFQTSLAKFLHRYSSIHIIADWPEDIAHFCRILITGPGMCLNTPALTFEIASIDSVSECPHNALEDAKANRKSYKPKR